MKDDPNNFREHVEFLQRQLGKSFGLPESLGIPPELVKGADTNYNPILTKPSGSDKIQAV